MASIRLIFYKPLDASFWSKGQSLLHTLSRSIALPLKMETKLFYGKFDNKLNDGEIEL